MKDLLGDFSMLASWACSASLVTDDDWDTFLDQREKFVQKQEEGLRPFATELAAALGRHVERLSREM